MRVRVVHDDDAAVGLSALANCGVWKPDIQKRLSRMAVNDEDDVVKETDGRQHDAVLFAEESGTSQNQRHR